MYIITNYSSMQPTAQQMLDTTRPTVSVTVPSTTSMGKISNITNSTDPTLVNARLFVGNLNTFVITKDDVENIFRRYGKIIGISMHKGFAFVQYTTEQEARNAIQGEDQRVYATQPIDVNMSAEPKPNRPSRKRPSGAGAEWDYYYNLPVARVPATATPSPGKRPCPDLSTMLLNPLNTINSLTPVQSPILPQRPLVPLPGAISNPVISAPFPHQPRKVLVPRSRPSVSSPSSVKTTAVTSSSNHSIMSVSTTASTLSSTLPAATQPATQSNHVNGYITNLSLPVATEDIIICGGCSKLFRSVSALTEHKKIKCNSPCNCASKNSISKEPLPLTCATCRVDFDSCWMLCQHCQTEHGIQIFVDTKDLMDKTVSDSSDSSEGKDSMSHSLSPESISDYDMQHGFSTNDRKEDQLMVNGL